MKTIVAGLVVAVLLSGCSASPKSFYANPSKVNITSLCRSLMDNPDPKFRRDVFQQIVARGEQPADCPNRVQLQNAGIIAIAIIGAGIGVAAAGGIPSGTGYQPAAAWDEFGGPFGMMWRCRLKANGQFTEDYNCPYFKDDSQWPGPYDRFGYR